MKRPLLILALAGCGHVAAPGAGMVPGGGSGTFAPVNEGGFEIPNLAAGEFQYTPAGSAWSFATTAGISANGSAFTGGNPDAPEGDQVLFVQGTGSASQSITLAAGSYRFLFQAAQRAPSNKQEIRFLLEGNDLGSLAPPDTGYHEFSTVPFTVTAGAHTLVIEGLNPLPGDHTAFLDDLRIEQLNQLAWSDPATWGGSLPGPTDDVTIPAGVHVLLDISATVRDLTVHGSLEVARANLALTATTVLVDGPASAFTCGTPSAPFLEDFTLTLLDGGVSYGGSITNGDFSANDELFTTWPGYTGGDNPGSITGWTKTGSGGGINGGDSGHTPFADNGAADGAVAFLQGPTSLTQTITGATIGEPLDLQFRYNTRDSASGTGSATLTVYAGATAIWNDVVDTPVGGSNPYYDSGVLTFNAPSSTFNLVFEWSVTGGDRTVLLDSITLAGSNPATIHPVMGTKFLGAMDGGRIDLHGPDRVDWTQLAAHAPAGATTLTLADPVDWTVGEEIVIASTDFDVHQAEQRTITGVSGDGLTVTLDAPLSYLHWGTLQTWFDGTDTHVLDQRAEVGLLTRNILVQGDAASETDGFGGHAMIMMAGCCTIPARAYCEGVEFFRMGQKGILARYPFHWHHAGNASGQFLRGCAVHRSFNRVLSVHNSDNALIEDTVGYDHIGHGYFLEDGGEVGNTFRRNLGILTRKPAAGEEVRPHDLVYDGDDTSFVKLPATFWITNPANDFIDNHAAGSEGSGFWMVVLNAPVGSYNGPAMIPGRMPMGEFRGNCAHSCSFSSFAIDGGIDPASHAFVNGHYHPRSNPFDFYSPIVVPEIHDFTGYKCRDRCVWLRADRFLLYDCALADNGRATFFSYNHVLHDSLIVGRSANVGTPVSSLEQSYGYSLPKPTVRTQFRGHSIYDGPSGIVNVHFAGFDDIDPAIQTNGAAQKSTVHYAEGTTFDPAIPHANKVDFTPAAWRDYMWSSGLIDRDGSITGTPGARLTPDIPAGFGGRVHEDINIAPGATSIPDWGAWQDTGTHYGLLRLDNQWAQYTSTPIYAGRSDGLMAYNPQTFDWYSQNAVVVNTPLKAHYQYLEIANRIDVNLRFVDDGDEVIAVFLNMPSYTYLYDDNTSTPLPQAASLTDLETGTNERYWFRDNTLYVKLVGAGGGYDPQFGNDFSSKSSSVKICQFANGANASGRTDRATLADFEMGNDSRGTLIASPGLGLTGPTASSPGPATGPYDATDDDIAFTATSDGDGVDEVVDYRLDFPRQVWNDYDALALSYSGPRVELLAEDLSYGPRSLGVFESADSGMIRLGSFGPDDALDEVTALVLRFRESDWSNLNAVVAQPISIAQVELVHSATAPFSVSYSPDADGDGILNVNEPAGDVDGDGLVNEQDPDSDGDKAGDGWELANGRDPWSPLDLAFEFNVDGDFEGWNGSGNLTIHGVANGALFGTTATDDGVVTSGGYHLPGSLVPAIHLKLKATANGSVQTYWGHSSAPGFSQSRFASTTYNGNGAWELVTLDYAGHPDWDGQSIVDLRFDPIGVVGADFEIDWIRASDGDMDNDGLADASEGTGDPDGDGLFNLEDPDSDNDGAGDALETTWGRNPYLAAEGTLDADADGHSDLFEMIAGFSPDDRDDRFAHDIEDAGGVARLTFDGRTGRTYTIEASSTLLPGSWVVVDTIGPLTADGPQTFDDPVAVGTTTRRFLRIGVVYEGP